MPKEFKDVSDKFYRDVLYKNFGGEPYLVLEDGTEVFRKDVKDSYTFFDYYDDKIAGGFFDKLDTPYMIATGAGTIVQIEDMMLTPEERSLILEKGLKIFYYEIMWYHAGIPKKFIVRENQNYTAKDFSFEFDNDTDFFCFDVDCVRVFMHKNNISNVELVVRDYGIAPYLSEKYPNIKISYRENYISTLSGTSNIRSSFDLDQDMMLNLNSKSIKNKFWCGNWRYADHRFLLAAFLVRLDSKISWAYDTALEDTNLWTMIERWKDSDSQLFLKLKQGASFLQTNVPYVLDINFKKTTIDKTQLFAVPDVGDEEYICPTVKPLPFQDYTSCFCAVVTESEFRRPSANISEKVINAIKAGRPFVLVSSPRSLEWLKQLGFKTFDRLWDESYDQETNHEQRLKKIFDVIEFIDSKSVDQLKLMYEEVKDILEHNLLILSTLRNIDTCNL